MINSATRSLSIYRLAQDCSADLPDEWCESLEGAFDRARQVPYFRDADSGGAGEVIKRPMYGMLGGDCDDKAVLIGAACERLGIPWRIVTTSRRPNKSIHHVYNEVNIDGDWLPVDATYAKNELFVAKPTTKKIVWPYMRRVGKYGVVTLEGDDASVWTPYMNKAASQITGGSVDVSQGLPSNAKDAVLAGLAIGVPGIGTVAAAVLGLISGLVKIKGPTAHLAQADAVADAHKFDASVRAWYNTLPAEGQAFVAAQALEWYNNALDLWGDNWGGFLKTWQEQAEAGGTFTPNFTSETPNAVSFCCELHLRPGIYGADERRRRDVNGELVLADSQRIPTARLCIISTGGLRRRSARSCNKSLTRL